jgi:DNA-binding CsgD family transcriptional regulator
MLACCERGLEAIGADPETTDLRLILTGNRAFALTSADRLADAGQAFREAVRMAESGPPIRLASIRLQAALYWFDVGDWDVALAELTDVQSPLTWQRLAAHYVRVLIGMHRDETEAGAEALREFAVSEQPTIESEWGEPRMTARALAAERDGDPRRVLAEFAPLLDPASAVVYATRFQLLPTAVRAALAVDDPAAARAAAADSAAEADRGGTRSMRAAAEQCRGLLTGDGGVLRAAGAEFAAVGRPLLAGQAFEDAAVAYAHGADEGAARAALGAALACYAGLGADYDSGRARRRLRRFGLRPVRAERRPVSGWAALTPAEVQVADLLRAGMSNPDIAAELVLSRRTVESHVSRILAKLGAKSRLEVIATSRPR